jgi:hypothetical protein
VALQRAAEIEPFFWPAVLNVYTTLKRHHDEEGIQELLDREKRVGADFLSTSIAIDNAYSNGNLAEAVNIGLGNLKATRNAGPAVGAFWSALVQLGFIDEAVKIATGPDFAPYLWRNDPKGLDMLESKHIDAQTFFKLDPLAENAGRVYLLSGRGKRLAEMYLSLKVSPEDFVGVATGDGPEHFLYTAPLIAVALRQNGNAQDAAALLSLAETKARQGLNDGDPLSSILLARICAVEGRKEDALPLLASAINRGWIPQPPDLLIDLHDDPALASMKGDPTFEKLRDQILGTIARERAQVNQRLLNQLRSS